MVVIRLSRGGTNKRPFYKVVVTDRRVSRDGLYLEHLGYFNPIATGGEKRLELKRDRITFWLDKGALPSERVISLLREFDHPEILAKRKTKRGERKLRQDAKAKTTDATTPKQEEVTGSN